MRCAVDERAKRMLHALVVRERQLHFHRSISKQKLETWFKVGFAVSRYSFVLLPSWFIACSALETLLMVAFSQSFNKEFDVPMTLLSVVALSLIHI